MNVFLDIETIPGQGLYEDYLSAELENFKAPSSLTKTQACADLGLTGNDAKLTLVLIGDLHVLGLHLA